MMTDAELERRFLDFVYATESRITPAAVAFHAECRLERAEALLDRLAATGKLHLEHDEGGSIFYVLPNRQLLRAPQSRGAIGHGTPPPIPVAQHHAAVTPVMIVGTPPAGVSRASRAGMAAPNREPAEGTRVDAAPPHVECPFCSEQILATARKCKHCNEVLDPALRAQLAPAPIQVNVQNVQTTQPQYSAMAASVPRVEPGVAALLSFLWPGAGQIYARHVGAGIGWMFFVVIGYLFFLLPGLILHIACIFSAASYARSENQRLGLP
jgi:TM2 domain-containing membrane protein YozV